MFSTPASANGSGAGEELRGKMKEEFYFVGDEGLMNAVVKTTQGSPSDIYPLTKSHWDHDFKFATDLLDKDNIRWVIKEIQNSRIPKRFRLFRSWGGLQFRTS